MCGAVCAEAITSSAIAATKNLWQGAISIHGSWSVIARGYGTRSHGPCSSAVTTIDVLRHTIVSASVVRTNNSAGVRKTRGGSVGQTYRVNYGAVRSGIEHSVVVRIKIVIACSVEIPEQSNGVGAGRVKRQASGGLQISSDSWNIEASFGDQKLSRFIKLQAVEFHNGRHKAASIRKSLLNEDQ